MTGISLGGDTSVHVSPGSLQGSSSVFQPVHPLSLSLPPH